MKNNKFRFSLYRMNIIDEYGLFLSDLTPRIRNDDQILYVIENATKPDFDYSKETKTALYKWGIREFTNYGSVNGRGPFVSIVLARSILEQDGQVVTPDRIINATSSSSPPLAETVLIFMDMSRHLAAVEYNSVLSRSRQWKVALMSIFLHSAHSLNMSSSIQFEEIPEKHEILKLFYSFQRLTRLRVHLRIPNPEVSRYTENLFKDLQAGEIRDYIQDMKNPNGICTEKEARPYASASLAQAGYKDGDVVFEGYKDGKFTTARSSEEAARGKIDSLKDYVRGISANAKTKETQIVLLAITEEIDRLHPQED